MIATFRFCRSILFIITLLTLTLFVYDHYMGHMLNLSTVKPITIQVIPVAADPLKHSKSIILALCELQIFKINLIYGIHNGFAKVRPNAFGLWGKLYICLAPKTALVV